MNTCSIRYARFATPASALPLELNVREVPWGAYDLHLSFLDSAAHARGPSDAPGYDPADFAWWETGTYGVTFNKQTAARTSIISSRPSRAARDCRTAGMCWSRWTSATAKPTRSAPGAGDSRPVAPAASEEAVSLRPVR